MENNTFSEDSIPQIEGLDTNAGLRRVVNNKKLYNKILRSFISNYRNSPTDVSNFLANNDLESARVSVHTVKGVSANLGYGILQQASLELETSLKENKPIEIIQENLVKYKTIMDGFVIQLESYFLIQ